ncbi:hypothetical protein T265_02126 [Opisthorchis viverrini]|uniref:Uncharacterized protein n=1 Tax=Opisthorchis viverrini TaxID=6198 RepID=A0A074ZVY1_OPIVI|nr:hypothetical protein T265_02126 [Opisthorchis viverrini]KER31613.1 hypothetical protein T265_02126 [Opisthorchis viverrini]
MLLQTRPQFRKALANASIFYQRIVVSFNALEETAGVATRPFYGRNFFPTARMKDQFCHFSPFSYKKDNLNEKRVKCVEHIKSRPVVNFSRYAYVFLTQPLKHQPLASPQTSGYPFPRDLFYVDFANV